MHLWLKDKLITWLCHLLGLPFRWRAPLDSQFRTPRSILILKPCCLGDVLMATPVISALRRAFPQARIGFAVGSWSRAMVEGSPHVDEIIACGRVGSGAHYGLREYLSLVKRIRAGKYDSCFVLDRSPLITLLPFLAGIPQRVGLDSRGRGFSLTLRVPVISVKHEAELYLDTVRAIGIEPLQPRLEFYPSNKDRKRAEELMLDAGQLATSGQQPVVAIHPGGGANPGMTLLAKRWPQERFAALADRLIEEYEARVLIVGAPSDRALAEGVKGFMRHELLDLTGQTTLGELGALLERCDLFVGHDTGAMHLAVALGTPVVAIFGPSDPRMYGPYGGQGIALWQGVGCNPCFIGGRFDASCDDYRCIAAVTVDEVWEAVERLLSREAREGD